MARPDCLGTEPRTAYRRGCSSIRASRRVRRVAGGRRVDARRTLSVGDASAPIMCDWLQSSQQARNLADRRRTARASTSRRSEGVCTVGSRAVGLEQARKWLGAEAHPCAGGSRTAWSQAAAGSVRQAAVAPSRSTTLRARPGAVAVCQDSEQCDQRLGVQLALGSRTSSSREIETSRSRALEDLVSRLQRQGLHRHRSSLHVGIADTPHAQRSDSPSQRS